MLKYVFIAATLALTAYGQTILKARAIVLGSGENGSRLHYLFTMFTDPMVLSGLAAAVLASFAWTLAVQQTAISIAYPFMALSFVIVPILARLFLHEQISAGQLVGMGMIVAGVSVAAVFK